MCFGCVKRGCDANAIPGVHLVDRSRVAASYPWGFLPPNTPFFFGGKLDFNLSTAS